MGTNHELFWMKILNWLISENKIWIGLILENLEWFISENLNWFISENQN